MTGATPTVTLWRLYYEDRSTWSDIDGPWLAAPCRGVMGLQYDDPSGRADPHDLGAILQTYDAYIWWPERPRPYGVDALGLLDYLVESGVMTEREALADVSLSRMRDAGVKLGRSVAGPVWREVRAWMRGDPDFTKVGILRTAGTVRTREE